MSQNETDTDVAFFSRLAILYFSKLTNMSEFVESGNAEGFLKRANVYTTLLSVKYSHTAVLNSMLKNSTRVELWFINWLGKRSQFYSDSTFGL